MLKIEKGGSETPLEELSAELERQLLERPTLSYEETVAVAQQLDLAGQIYSSQADGQVNQASTSDVTQPIMFPSPLVAQLIENVDTLRKKVSELSQSVASINAASTRRHFGGQRGPCYQCGKMGHIANECRSPEEIVDEQIIDSAKWKITALFVEILAILQGNVNFGASPLPMLYHVREATKADPLLCRVSARDDPALPINCIKLTAVFIKTQVGEHERKCLVDTGATVSLVSREFISGHLKPCSLKAQGIGGENLQVLGPATTILLAGNGVRSAIVDNRM